MNRTIDLLILLIADPTDGPLTPFVLMGRACQLATIHNPLACAEALFEVMTDNLAPTWAQSRLTMNNYEIN